MDVILFIKVTFHALKIKNPRSSLRKIFLGLNHGVKRARNTMGVIGSGRATIEELLCREEAGGGGGCRARWEDVAAPVG